MKCVKFELPFKNDNLKMLIFISINQRAMTEDKNTIKVTKTVKRILYWKNEIISIIMQRNFMSRR